MKKFLCVFLLGSFSLFSSGAAPASAGSPLDGFIGTWCGSLNIQDFDTEASLGSHYECWVITAGPTPYILNMTYSDATTGQVFLNRISYSQDYVNYVVQAVDKKKAWIDQGMKSCINNPGTPDCIQAVDDEGAWYQAGLGHCDYTAQPVGCLEFYSKFDNMKSAGENVYVLQNAFHAVGGAVSKSGSKRVLWDGVLTKQST